jgi:hypothetical protein
VDALVELDFRSSGEIEVSLFWERVADRLLVQVVDWQRDEAFSFPVPPESALEAFRHPYAYSPRERGASVTDALRARAQRPRGAA